MEHSTKQLILKLLNSIIIFGFFALLVFSIFLINLYMKINETNKTEVIIQDINNLEVEYTESNIKIEYGNTPKYLYEYIDCLNNGIKKDNFSKELNVKIFILNNYLKSYSNKVQLAYTDINTGFKINYNSNTKLFAASTTKAPLALYIYMLADQGKIDLNKKYKYTKKYYADGTGTIKNNKVNTDYSVRDLTKYSIIYSDNIAFLMLSDIVNKKDVSNYFKSKGTKYTFNSSNKSGLYQTFGELSANDGNIYMTELYKYSLNNSKNSNELLNYFKKASLNNIKLATNKDVAHKYGWTNKYVHDMGLVFDENPYVITITSTLGDKNWGNVFKNIARQINDIHESYWSETKQYCKNNLK